MRKTKCEKCNNFISNNNYKKHVKSCNGFYVKFKKSNCCKYCGICWVSLNITKAHEIANHSRWCDKNPKKEKYLKELNKKLRSNFSSDVNKKRAKGVKNAWLRGAYKNADFGKGFKNKKHSEKTKKILQEKALKSNHRRLRKGTILYKNVLLDSTWEYELAKRLDELNIKWVRPKPLKWVDKNNIEHNYFPDFYLIDFDIFLDPKNPAAYENQKEKIKILKNTYGNIRFLTTLEECKTFTII